jgi:hypothetical protein
MESMRIKSVKEAMFKFNQFGQPYQLTVAITYKGNQATL